MRLERAGGGSGEAGLAGWISTNDVTLFTMVLVVLIALALHSSLVKKRKSNEALALDLSSTSAELDSTIRKHDTLDEELRQRRAELAAQGKTLEQAETQLKITKTERDQLNEDLTATQKLIASLQSSLEGLQTENTTLESTQVEYEAQVETLTQQKAQLVTERASLNEQLTGLGKQLEEKLAALRDVEEHRAQLKQQVDELEKIVTTLQAKVETTSTDLAATRQQASEQGEQAAARIAELEGMAEQKGTQVEDYLAKLRRATEAIQSLKLEKRATEEQLTATELRYQQQLLMETTVNRELVGIKGPLSKVAIIFDASGSMKEETTQGNGDRWSEAQQIAQTWLQHLDVDECVLIVFSSDVRTFPEDGTFAKLTGETEEVVRKELLDKLTKVEPDGWTNTLGALRKAYSYEGLDSIILFSDGAPTNPNLGTFDAEVARSIYTLCSEHSNIPINSVGLGNYFDPELATFLRTVARLTGGTFRGR